MQACFRTGMGGSARVRSGHYSGGAAAKPTTQQHAGFGSSFMNSSRHGILRKEGLFRNFLC